MSRATEVLDLIRSLPDADAHIHRHKGEWWVTTEWFVGTIAGRAFTGATQEAAAEQLVAYLDEHMGHDSVTGRGVDASGWPSLSRVRDYVTADAA